MGRKDRAQLRRRCLRVRDQLCGVRVEPGLRHAGRNLPGQEVSGQNSGKSA